MPCPPIPAGFHTVTPTLVVPDGTAMIKFLQEAFGATLHHRSDRPDGTLMHAITQIGDSMVEVGGVNEQFAPTTAALHLYVPDATAFYKRALRAGAASLYPPTERFYGDLEAGVKDPAGNRWFIAAHVEDVPPAELKRRAVAASAAAK